MRILLIDDDQNLCTSLTYQLEKAGFITDYCTDGSEAPDWITQNIHDLILLDRMLPGKSGLEILKEARIKGCHTPIILLTALGELQDKLDGLHEGADDYIVKPFSFEELLARMQCILRRPKGWEAGQVISFGDVSYISETHAFTCQKINQILSKREGDLLECFLRNPNQTLPRGTLLSKVWGMDAEVEDGNLDNYIHFLRRRLQNADSRLVLKTKRGIGYVLEEKHV